ncbi:MAG: methionine synthase [Euryarchaeota archaeon]|nr:methionine synthase [Euryarchaeota archaeon]
MRTTVIGSYPLRYEELGGRAIERAVEEQISAGVDLVSDGQTRADMVSVYAGVLEGVELRPVPGSSERKLHIVGKVALKDPSIFVDDHLLAEKTASGRAEVKAVLTGPATLAFSSVLDTRGYSGYRDPALFADLSGALLGIARELQKAGARHFQIDEPFFSVGVPMELAQEAVESIATGLQGEVALHVCGDVSKVFDSLLGFRGVRVLSHGFAGTPANLALVSRGKLERAGKVLGFGCVDSASEAVEDQGTVIGLLQLGMRLAGKTGLVVHPDCGLRALPRDVARAKLEVMCRAARSV